MNEKTKGIITWALIVSIFVVPTILWIAYGPKGRRVEITSRVVSKKQISGLDVTSWLLLDIPMMKTEYYLYLEDGSSHYVSRITYDSYQVGDLYTYGKVVYDE